MLRSRSLARRSACGCAKSTRSSEPLGQLGATGTERRRGVLAASVRAAPVGLGAEAAHTTAYFQFDDGARAWQRRQAGVGCAPRLPSSSTLSCVTRSPRGTCARRLTAPWACDSAARPPDLGVGLVRARSLRLGDLVPRGYVVEIEGVPGVVVPSGERRHLATVSFSAAVALGTRSVLAIRSEWAGVVGGNVNHSVTLGSLEGVRRLADTNYRNRQQAFANLEQRSALRLAERWALQGVAFSDGAVFEQMDADGRVSPWASAAGAGVGHATHSHGPGRFASPGRRGSPVCALRPLVRPSRIEPVSSLGFIPVDEGPAPC